MEQYESKQVRINRPASTVYDTLSDFSRFTPILRDRVEGWDAQPDWCSFRAQGITFRLRIVDREPHKTIKMTADDGSPIGFTCWIQLRELAPDDTRMRLVLHAELNMMMKMMIGDKLRQGLDAVAEKIAEAFNRPSEPAGDLFAGRPGDLPS